MGVLTQSFLDTSHYLKKYTDYINSLAYKDALTGVKNTASYDEAVEALEQKMQLGYHDFGVIVFDANGLKQVNDE